MASEFECPTCDRAFPTEAGMKTHHTKIHGESLNKQPEENFQCPTCEEWFPTKRGLGIHRTTIHGTIEKVCEACGEDFAVKPSRENVAKTCSYKCAGELQAERYAEARVDLECLMCGTEFEVKPNEVDRRLTCSRECQTKWQKKYGPRGEEHPAYKSGLVELACKQCGDNYELIPALAKHSNFCSKKCHNQWMHENQRGPNHHQWTGGGDKWYGPNWPEQREKARKRDKYTCQSCGVHEAVLPRELNVHHIIPFDDFAPFETAEDYDEANDESNLVSLCDTCHANWEGIHARPILIGAECATLSAQGTSAVPRDR